MIICTRMLLLLELGVVFLFCFELCVLSFIENSWKEVSLWNCVCVCEREREICILYIVVSWFQLHPVLILPPILKTDCTCALFYITFSAARARVWRWLNQYNILHPPPSSHFPPPLPSPRFLSLVFASWLRGSLFSWSSSHKILLRSLFVCINRFRG